IAVNASPSPSAFGQPVTFTAAITALSPATHTPTGTVTFQDGSTTLGIGTLDSNGHATFATSALAAGPHAVSAIYGGDANFTAAGSDAFTQTVSPGAATVTVTSSANSPSFG